MSIPDGSKCPTCKSPSKELHPALQVDGGEVHLCRDAWHGLLDPRMGIKTPGALASPLPDGRLRKAPAEIRHEWYRKKERGAGVYECPHCKMWTANVPMYFSDVCSARERRKVADRRGALLASPLHAGAEPCWQPMEMMPEDRQVIVCWSYDSFDTISRKEYLEIMGYGEPPAKGWMPLPPAPLAALKPLS